MWADIDTSSRTNLPQHRCSGFFISVEGDSLYAREGDVRHGRHVCLVEWSSLFRSDVVVERRGTARVSEVFRQRRKRREPVCTRHLLVLTAVRATSPVAWKDPTLGFFMFSNPRGRIQHPVLLHLNLPRTHARRPVYGGYCYRSSGTGVAIVHKSRGGVD